MTYTNNKTPTTEPIVWVIDDDQALRMILEDTLTDSGFKNCKPWQCAIGVAAATR